MATSPKKSSRTPKEPRSPRSPRTPREPRSPRSPRTPREPRSPRSPRTPRSPRKEPEKKKLGFQWLLLIYIFFTAVAFLSAFLARDVILEIIERNIHIEDELNSKIIAFVIVVILIILAVYFLVSIADGPIRRIYPFLN